MSFATASIPMRSFSRTSILQGLQATLAQGQPIVAVSAGAGIVAKCAEVGGADLLLVVCTGRSRHLGVPTTVTLGNANAMTLALYPQIDNVVDHTPIIGGVEASDPTRRRLGRVVDEYHAFGFDGITNFPSVGAIPSWGRARTDVGQGVEREYELIERCRTRDIFTIGMAFSEEHARGLAAAGADVLVARCGLTAGGLSGPSRPLMSLEAAVGYVQEIVEAARGENRDIICLAHGGPLVTADDTQRLYDRTDVQGFLGESSIERLPIEQGVAQAARDYKAQPLRASAIR
ncbi:MAG: phosphoenolpyruvate hydrolase family protein [Chloroflexi bacterium]|nr:phosphoenolpyruvate hydrolase family protein [Chloroflexota bacterium]